MRKKYENISAIMKGIIMDSKNGLKAQIRRYVRASLGQMYMTKSNSFGWFWENLYKYSESSLKAEL